jgi:hypothetical protein
MKRDLLFFLYIGDVHHFLHQLLGVLNFNVNLVLFYHFVVLVDVLKMEVLDFSLQLFLLLVDRMQIMPHELVNVEVVIPGAFGSICKWVSRRLL